MDMRHKCPGGCGTLVPPELLACKQDWRRLPGEIQRRVWAGYRMVRAGGNAAEHHAAIREALSWYRDNPYHGGIRGGLRNGRRG